MCEFCENKRNITRLEDNAEISLKYCPMCGDSLTGYNEYFISINGGEEVYWVADLEEAAHSDTLAYLMSHSSEYHFEFGIPVYRAVQVGEIQGYPKFVKH